MTLLGTADVDCLLRDGDGDDVVSRSRGDRDLLEASWRTRSEPSEGDMLFELFGRPSIPPPGWNGSVTARGRDLGRPGESISMSYRPPSTWHIPLSGGVSES